MFTQTPEKYYTNLLHLIDKMCIQIPINRANAIPDQFSGVRLLTSHSFPTRNNLTLLCRCELSAECLEEIIQIRPEFFDI